MCLIVFDWQPESAVKLRLAANRDEFHARPAEPLHSWPDAELIGGRDLLGGGTWLAATHSRVAALTNVRDGLAWNSSRLAARRSLTADSGCQSNTIRHMSCLLTGKRRAGERALP